MIIINKNVYSNPHDEIGENKTEITEWITKIIKVLQTCVVYENIIVWANFN